MAQGSPNLASQVVQVAALRVRTLAQEAAARIGRPIDAQAPTQAEQARLWNLQNPQADMAQVQALVDSGQHGKAVDMLYPWRSKLYGSGTPAARVQKAESISTLAARASQAESNAGANTTDGEVNY